jgi:hypothetical protein
MEYLGEHPNILLLGSKVTEEEVRCGREEKKFPSPLPEPEPSLLI